MKARDRFVAACRFEKVDRPPVWLMRQAGRYLPEYRDLRQQHSFWDMVRTPALAIEATMQPIRRYGMDAGILFSDILPILDAMGAQVAFHEGGPVIGKTVRSAADLAALKPFVASRDLPYVGEAVRGLCEQLHPERALIGFSGAPLTLAAYLIEGKGSKDLKQLKTLAYREPALVHKLLQLLAEGVADLLSFQIECGVDAVQVFDTWAGLLTPEDYRSLALPYQRLVVELLKDKGVPVILYMRGYASNLEDAVSTGADVLSLDTSVDLGQVRTRLGTRVALQGNLDPIALFAPVESVVERTRSLIEGSLGQGHILNLGQGLVPETPVEGVAAFVNTAQEYGA
ncbi:MAG: uroporphyrinogen decarboxylase [Pseudomonadota bacterium]